MANLSSFTPVRARPIAEESVATAVTQALEASQRALAVSRRVAATLARGGAR
jgi:hypothetical protein